ncbi:DUF3306 domain-containing protein [Vreelandella populi]|uniref:DUF3306 domain-containing protein n=1 Tax=Vreelandella populi TaxID=2498858 RepID=A0A3S0WP30_9GAMM|nr:DUF3306 domain-containing protein [Halomonas populi]RUR35342.1 DUF3306 domain-containing protein [Halomonas populi]RUR47533.1 DUF3306 domain-containing protein [Halomonas populi]RUR54599.1 DUF3306 domain-containing protein [Halomonas populi]
MSRWERWSQLKRGVESSRASSQPEADEAQTRGAETQVHEEDAQAVPAADPPPDPTEPEVPAPGSLDDSLPDPDLLPAGSDFSIFMASGVSAALRRRALKRLWATGNYNVRDGLDDYDADYRQQLKPMAEGLADKLRRWTHKAEEVLESSDCDETRESAVVPNESQDDTNTCTQPAKAIERAATIEKAKTLETIETAETIERAGGQSASDESANAENARLKKR